MDHQGDRTEELLQGHLPILVLIEQIEQDRRQLGV